MASGSELNLCCPICHDIFDNPVLLSCSHSFCKACLQRWWRQKQSHKCPVCQSTSGRKHPPCNLALKNLCEAFLLERDQSAETLCGLHSEKLKLFCLDHQQPVCLVCRDSEKHTEHRFRPIDEAARDRREELQKTLKPLEKKLKLFKRIKGNFVQTAEHIRVQARHAKREIKKQFKKLHEFLNMEEDERIAAVKDEEKQKREMMKEKMEALSRQIEALSDTVRATEEELRAEDISFLHSYAASVDRVQRCPQLEEPQLHLGALIDEAKHLGNLNFNIWNKMNEVCDHSYSPVILDPNTAHPGIVLSEDLSCVRWGERPKLPDNPQRFDSSCIVLGSEGFESGLHSWEVEVGDSSHWILGVAPESVERKGHLDSRSGLWTVALHKSTYKAFSPLNPMFALPVKKQLQRIRVDLDCDRKELSFSDPNKLIHTFSCTSTEALFPFIGTSDEYLLRIRPHTENNTSYSDDDDEDSDDNDFKCDSSDDSSVFASVLKLMESRE
ncbi:nuclear factor 7, ovary-like [Stegastes partitus]|uniref:Nuclear factor 7, ovary-like n=1 Tax=Stegastes partitus TaxID=144197 RepID=A0A3B4ZR12_9TELE|nr:PREDICTED: nuclear factor 7, ovary-like [Stegastes partitus]